MSDHAMGAAMKVVSDIIDLRPDEVHTVMASVNGGHGGVDLIVQGTNPDGSQWQTIAEVPR